MDMPVTVMVTLLVLMIMYAVYKLWLKDWLEYRKAHNDIYGVMVLYRQRTTGQNRFIITTETLRESFPDYDEEVITRVWLELVKDRIIEKHSIDNEWGIQ